MVQGFYRFPCFVMVEEMLKHLPEQPDVINIVILEKVRVVQEITCSEPRFLEKANVIIPVLLGQKPGFFF